MADLSSDFAILFKRPVHFDIKEAADIAVELLKIFGWRYKSMEVVNVMVIDSRPKQLSVRIVSKRDLVKPRLVHNAMHDAMKRKDGLAGWNDILVEPIKR